MSEDYKTDLKKEMLFFSNVDTIDPASIRWSSIRFQRNNNTYRMLISLCQLVLEGMLMSTDSGEYRLASFVDEQRMSRLYEKFILEYYAKECPQVKATASQIPWALDDGVGTLLPVMQSDIMLTQGINLKSRIASGTKIFINVYIRTIIFIGYKTITKQILLLTTDDIIWEIPSGAFICLFYQTVDVAV